MINIEQIYDVSDLQLVTTEILNWDYDSLTGEGVFSKIEKFAHIEIKIYKSDFYTDHIIWSANEESISEEYFSSEVKKAIVFFANYLTALKGRREKKLVFEIVNGSFNWDSNRNSFT